MADATQQDLDLLSDDDLYVALGLAWGNSRRARHVEFDGIEYLVSDLETEWTARLDEEALAESVYE